MRKKLADCYTRHSFPGGYGLQLASACLIGAYNFFNPAEKATLALFSRCIFLAKGGKLNKKLFFEAATWPARNTYALARSQAAGTSSLLGSLVSPFEESRRTAARLRERPLMDYEESIRDIGKAKRELASAASTEEESRARRLFGQSAALAWIAVYRAVDAGLRKPHEAGQMIVHLDEITYENYNSIYLAPEVIEHIRQLPDRGDPLLAPYLQSYTSGTNQQ